MRKHSRFPLWWPRLIKLKSVLWGVSMSLMPSSSVMKLLALLGVFAPILAHGANPAGCGTEGLPAGRQSITVISSGLSRSVLLYVPAAGAKRRAVPLIIDLHGSGGNGEEQAHTTRLADLAAKEGFVVANPSGGVTF